MKLTLVRRKTEVPGVESFVFKPEEPLTWSAGQYLHYVLHHEPTDDRGSDRWFTVASAPFEQEVMITTRITDENSSTFKSALAALKTGESIEISHVEGDFVFEGPEQEYVFIAGGIGITPFRSILKQQAHTGVPVRAALLYANRDEYIPFQEELAASAAQNPDLHIHYIIAPDCIDEQKIRQLVPDLQKPIFYVSGPEPMVEALGHTLKSMGVPANHIKQDWFPGYSAD